MSRDLASLWQRLEEEASHELPGAGVRRLVDDTGAAEVHLGLSPDGHRQVWVRMGDGWSGDPSSLPRWRGARIRVHRGQERPRPRTFVVLEQTDGSVPDVFVSLAGYLCQALERADAGSSVEDSLATILDTWRMFFEEDGLEGLSREAQQGLWGELWVLREQLIPRLGVTAAIDAWTGSQRTNHDFQREGRAIEVKTTSGRGHHAMRIKSERQLDTTGISSLHVIFLVLARIDSGGESLPAMITAVRALASSQPKTARLLEEQLLAARYIDLHGHLYRTGFACRDARAYHVRAGFPRITETDLPPGIGDVAYSISLDACGEFIASMEGAVAAFAAPQEVVS